MIKKIIALLLCTCMFSATVSESVIAAGTTTDITLAVGATQTVEFSGADNTATGFDSHIATAEVHVGETVYTKANDVTCNEVLSYITEDWVETSYYYKENGAYYPLCAKKKILDQVDGDYRYIWGYKTSSTHVEKIGNQKVEGDNPKTDIDIYTMSASDTGEVTFTGISPGTTTVSIGETTYNITVTDATYANTKIIHVPEGKNISISGVGGTFIQNSLDTAVATVTHNNNTLNIHGVSQGETAVVVGDTRYLIRVDRVSIEATGWDNSKYINIEVKEITNCDVYYAINGGKLNKVDGIGILLNQSYLGGIHLTFYAAPKSGYALTSMGATAAAGKYESLGNDNIKESEAWTKYINNPFFSNDQLEDLLTRAVALGCQGSLLFSRRNYDGAAIESDLRFKAEPLPTLEKTIKGYFKNGKGTLQNFTDDTVLSIGDKIRYQFYINEQADGIDYSNITLYDDTINYSRNIQDADIKGSPTYTQDYTLNQDDLEAGLYAGGVFINEAHLDYNYSSEFKVNGVFGSISQSSVSAKINGLVTYGWDESLPTEVQNKALPAAKAHTVGEDVTVASNTYQPVTIVDDSTNTTTTYTFSHWETSDLDGTDDQYSGGEIFTMPTDSSVHFVGIWNAETVQNTTDLTITKSGAQAIDENQSFMFHIEGVADTNTAEISLDVVIHGNDSVTITDLPMGEYTVTEDKSWSWRYIVVYDESVKTINLSNDNNTVSFTNTRIIDKWLNGNAWCDNLWNGNSITPNHDYDGEVTN